jgi:hypothetical protein
MKKKGKTCPHPLNICCLLLCCRDALAAQLQLLHTKADSETLARGIAEEQLSDVEKEKTMLELEVKELMSRHKNDINKKESQIAQVKCNISTILVKQLCDFKNGSYNRSFLGCKRSYSVIVKAEN